MTRASPKILVADDDDDLRRMVLRFLDRGGYEVSEVKSGRDALAAALTQQFDLVITDVYMPNMDGIEFITRVGQGPNPPRVIVMSGGGHADQATVLDIAGRLGAVSTLSKPFTQAELLAAVKAALGPA